MVRTTKASDPKRKGCICMRFRKAARRVSQVYDHHLEPMGLTVTQYGLLVGIQRQDDITIGMLAQRMAMDPTTLTRNLQPLTRQGLLSQSVGPKDRRNKCLRLTRKGLDALAKARPAWAKAQRQIAGTLGPDLGAATDIIDRLLLRLDHANT